MVRSQENAPGALLGDTASRDYSRKLSQFNEFAAAELGQALQRLGVMPGMKVLDAGCGSGEVLRWLDRAVAPGGIAVGIDLAAAHTSAARSINRADALIVQGNLGAAPFAPGGFDLVWCANTINHLSDPVAGVVGLSQLLRSDGTVALGQSSLVPDMYFAWDERLEREVTQAVRHYYRERYGLTEQATTALRALVGVMHAAQLARIEAHTLVIERIAPLRGADVAYLQETIFAGTWGERLCPYLAAADYAQLQRLTDPQHAEYALRRPDFHFLQTLTVVTGVRSARA